MAAAAAPDGTTVGSLTRRIAGALRSAFAGPGRAGTPDLDARLLVAHAVGEDPAHFPLMVDRPVAAADVARAEALAARRIAGEPVARILGTWDFWTLRLALSAETLVPRPDTETVVEAALAVRDREGGRNAALRILDLGTGSGAILLALLAELPAARGLGIDRSEGAARTARANAAANRLAERAAFAVGDWAAAVSGPFDLVVSNPPYIATAEIGDLAVEVRAHDPHMALDGGADGFAAHRAIIGDLRRILAPSGHAFVEIGHGQGPRLAAIAGAAGFATESFRDLAGTERVVALSRARRSGDD